MNKLILNNNEEDKKIITFTINKEIKRKVKEMLEKSKNYNLKKKSEWVNEAIVALRDNPDYKALVCNAEGNSEDFVFDKICMIFKQRCFFYEMRNETVKAYPDIKGPQASIIRAAILSRLMRNGLKNVD